MNSCKPNIDAIKDSLRTRYRQEAENEVPDNRACKLAFVIINVLLELTGETLDEYDQALRRSIGDNKTSLEFH